MDVWDKSVAVEENRYYWKGEPVVFEGKIEDDGRPLAIELFSGCGGTSLGFEMAGFQIALGCDIHEPSIKTFKTNHPSAYAIMGDLKKVTPAAIKKILGDRTVDVLIGGVPCQGFSLNNRKRNVNDHRNELYKEFVRFVRALKPRAIVLENVSGMISTGSYVDTIERELSAAGGMSVKSQLLFAADYGVPQARKRLVFIGVGGNEGFDFSRIRKTHGPGTGKPFVTVKEAIGDLPSLKANEEKKNYKSSPANEYQKTMRQGTNGNALTNHKSPNHPAEVIEKIAATRQGEPMYPRFKQRIRLAWDMLSPTQVSGGIRPQFQFGHPSDARGLSIRERCRLQSFPDTFEVLGGIVQGRVQTGNAVPPLLAKAIALAIREYL